MSNTPQMDNFFKLFVQNAQSVLETITNESISFSSGQVEDFSMDVVSESIELPLILLSFNFSGDYSFGVQLGFKPKTIAILSDLMMMGDGSAEYDPDEHNDAAQEMFNQVLGSFNAEISGLGWSVSGTVSNVEQTDMEAYTPLLQNSGLAMLTMDMMGAQHPIAAILGTDAYTAIDKIFPTTDAAAVEEEPEAAPAAEAAQPGPAAAGGTPRPAQQQRNEQPVNVSRASLSEIHGPASILGESVNVDLLMEISLPISVELGKKNMRIRDILEMGQGSVIELDKLAGDFVDILVNGQKFAVGEIMVVDDNFAIRIVNLISREERIRSLGQ